MRDNCLFFKTTHIKRLLAVLIAMGIALCCGGCGILSNQNKPFSFGSGSGDNVISGQGEGTRGSSTAVLLPVASGEKLEGTKEVAIDYSNTQDGYIMVGYAGDNKKVKIQLKSASEQQTYTYDLNPQKYGSYEVFPLSQGSGTYEVRVMENAYADMYSELYTLKLYAQVADECRPFLFPNQTVNFTPQSQAVQLGEQLADSADQDLDVVANVFDYIIKNIVYDTEKAQAAVSGQLDSSYVPDVDETLQTKKGICFDYAALMAAMLRSQGIPCRLVKGNAGNVYHAWVTIYSTETGMIDRVIEFKGNDWTLMDPTFSASAGAPKDFVGEGTNYYPMYIY